MASERSGDPAMREIADAVDRSRPRVAADIDDPDVPVAGTVVLLRDGGDGPEALMIERPDHGSFAAAWVFPGGKVETSDRAGAGPDASEREVARVAAVRETAEEVALGVEVDALVPLSCWDPPPGIPRRIRTWFFVARAPDAVPVLAPGEAVAAAWLRPAEVLRRHGGGALTLYPPTWVTLHGLAALASRPPGISASGLPASSSVDDLLALVRGAGVRAFASVVRRAQDGPLFLWQEDAAYDGLGALDAPGPRHRLQTGALPWTYTRTR